jgi:hypothetical protein
MGSSACLHGQMAIFFKATEVMRPKPDGIFWVEMANGSGGFISLHFLHDGINCHFLQGLISTGSINRFFNFL